MEQMGLLSQIPGAGGDAGRKSELERTVAFGIGHEQKDENQENQVLPLQLLSQTFPCDRGKTVHGASQQQSDACKSPHCSDDA